MDACRHTYHKPAETVQGAISDLHASRAATSELDTSHSISLSEIAGHYVDRCYKRPDTKQFQLNLNKYGNEKQFVCQKQRYWFTNHTTK